MAVPLAGRWAAWVAKKDEKRAVSTVAKKAGETAVPSAGEWAASKACLKAAQWVVTWDGAMVSHMAVQMVIESAFQLADQSAV